MKCSAVSVYRPPPQSPHTRYFLVGLTLNYLDGRLISQLIRHPIVAWVVEEAEEQAGLLLTN